jgi:hypothetical protein
MSRRHAEPLVHLTRAVVSLATGSETLRIRLPRVYPVLVNIRAADLPEPLREDFEWVMKRLTARPPRHNGPTIWETTAEASVAAMGASTVAKVARMIVGLSERLRTIAANE